MRSHPPELLIELLYQLMLEMFREGIIPEEIASRIALRFEDQAKLNAGLGRAERFATLARMAEMFPLDSAVQTGWRSNEDGEIVPLTAVTSPQP